MLLTVVLRLIRQDAQTLGDLQRKIEVAKNKIHHDKIDHLIIYMPR